MHSFNFISLGIVSGCRGYLFYVVNLKEMNNCRITTECFSVVAYYFARNVELCKDEFKTFDDSLRFLILHGDGYKEVTVEIDDVEGSCNLASIEGLFLFEYHKINHPSVVRCVRERDTTPRYNLLVSLAMKAA